MKQFSLSSSLMTFMLAWLCSTPVSAYTIFDKSDLDLNLPPGWKLLDITRSPGMIVTNYSKPIPGTKLEESLVEAQMTKEKGKDPAALVKDMVDRVTLQALAQHCELEDVMPLPEDNGQFKVWTQTFQCKPSDSGIIQLYIDADPQTMYLFTYTTPHYPFKPEIREAADQLLRDSIQVCYKGKGCSTF